MMQLSAPPASARSPKAYRLYRQLVETSNAQPIVLCADDPVTDAIFSWDHLPLCEAYMFSIDPRLANALLWAYVRYKDLCGITNLDFAKYRDQERAAFPACVRPHYSVNTAAVFMALSCNLPYTQCLAWVCRSQIQSIRSCLFDEDGAAPAWAYGYVVEV